MLVRQVRYLEEPVQREKVRFFSNLQIQILGNCGLHSGTYGRLKRELANCKSSTRGPGELKLSNFNGSHHRHLVHKREGPSEKRRSAQRSLYEQCSKRRAPNQIYLLDAGCAKSLVSGEKQSPKTSLLDVEVNQGVVEELVGVQACQIAG